MPITFLSGGIVPIVATPENAYVIETDPNVPYVAEDGTTFYVFEDSSFDEWWWWI